MTWILLVAAVACGRKNGQELHSAAADTFPFAERIGWLHGACLAIPTPDLARGARVAMVIAGEPQRVQEGRIGERTQSPGTCPALIQGRTAVNAKPGMFFYLLDAGNIGASDMGFGIVAPPANPEVVNARAQVDLDQDGRPEVFSTCATTEGIRFAVWTEKAFQGEPRWSAYEYLDYETQPTCP